MRKLAFWALLFFIFTLPWEKSFDLGPGVGSVGRVAGVIAFATGVAAVLTSARVRALHSFHILTIAFLSLVTLSLFWSADQVETPHIIRVYFQSAWVVWLLWELAPDNKSIYLAEVAYVVGAYVSAIGVLHNFATHRVLQTMTEARFSADGWDFNEIAVVLALAIPMACLLATRGHGFWARWLGRGYLIVGPFAILLTSSRTGFIVAGIGLITLLPMHSYVSLTAKTILAGVIVVGLLIAFVFTPEQVWRRVETIPMEVRAADLNGRVSIWATGMRTFEDNPIIGVGAGAFKAGSRSYYEAHNTYLEVLTEEGLIGFTIFLFMVGCAVRSLGRGSAEQQTMLASLLSSWVVGTFALHCAAHAWAWLVLGLIVTQGHTFSDAGRESPAPLAETTSFPGAMTHQWASLP
jgi:O-antigen ligase